MLNHHRGLLFDRILEFATAIEPMDVPAQSVALVDIGA
jgi:hypothetical protein